MLAAIIFGTVLAQERTVTFTYPCAHSSVVLEAFGREIGEVIKPSGSVVKDYFLVRFEGMPVEDVGSRVVMAGLVDSHVHVNEPGRTPWEGFETATRAAASGGVTAIVDMPLNSAPVTTSA